MAGHPPVLFTTSKRIFGLQETAYIKTYMPLSKLPLSPYFLAHTYGLFIVTQPGKIHHHAKKMALFELTTTILI